MQTHCTPCEAGGASLGVIEVESRLMALPGWHLENDEGILKLHKQFACPDFKATMALANAIADASEHEGHHPVMLLEFRALRVWWWTHKISGLHENDFIMAAQCEALCHQPETR